MDKDGHLVHIDFGFLLGNYPGNVMKCEKVPFKLTNEFVKLLGGAQSEGF
jgi:phosphatidylinositol 4-kinase